MTEATAPGFNQTNTQIFTRSSLFYHQKCLNPCGFQPSLLCGTVVMSWISVCEGSKGGGREASLRSCQHYTKVPEGVAPTQLSLPVTCIDQLLPCSGSGYHQ